MWEVHLFWGPILEAKWGQNAFKKDMQKLIKFSHAFLMKLGRILELFWRILVDKIAIQVEHKKKRKWAFRRGGSSVFKVPGHALGRQNGCEFGFVSGKKIGTLFDTILASFWRPFWDPKSPKMEAKKWSRKGSDFWGANGSAWRSARTPWKSILVKPPAGSWARTPRGRRI